MNMKLKPKLPDYRLFLSEQQKPSQNNSFWVEFVLPKQLRDINSGPLSKYPIYKSIYNTSENQMFQNMFYKTTQDLLNYSIQDIPDLTFQLQSIGKKDKIEFGNLIRFNEQGQYYQNDSLLFTFREYQGKPVTKLLMEWLKLQNDPETGQLGFPDGDLGYKGEMYKVEFMKDTLKMSYDGYEDIEYHNVYNFVGIFPTQVNIQSETQYDEDQIQTVSQTFKIDQIFDWI